VSAGRPCPDEARRLRRGRFDVRASSRACPEEPLEFDDQTTLPRCGRAVRLQRLDALRVARRGPGTFARVDRRLLAPATQRVRVHPDTLTDPHHRRVHRQLRIFIPGLGNQPHRTLTKLRRILPRCRRDFCNRFSHGEGNESVDVLDARAVHGQIRRCVEFLRAVDGEHFERMFAAIGIDPAVIA
jgi:hypothetical protein